MIMRGRDVQIFFSPNHLYDQYKMNHQRIALYKHKILAYFIKEFTLRCDMKHVLLRANGFKSSFLRLIIQGYKFVKFILVSEEV